MNNFNDYYNNYHIDNDMMKEFRSYAESSGATWNEEQYSTDGKYIRNTIKGYLARYIWNREKMVQILNSNDRQLLKAIELFPMAEKLLTAKK